MPSLPHLLSLVAKFVVVGIGTDKIDSHGLSLLELDAVVAFVGLGVENRPIGDLGRNTAQEGLAHGALVALHCFGKVLDPFEMFALSGKALGFC
jgi:hypothetical protein